MFGSAKYIVLDKWGYATDAMIIFPASLNHANMAQNFGGQDNVMSAGFIQIGEDGKPQCAGESKSLGVRSRPEDDILAKILLENKYNKQNT